jgi:hypothetical protein
VASVLPERSPAGAWLREVLRTGTLAGLAMIPFAAAFRARGLRINEYGRKMLELAVGEVAPPLHGVLTFAQHLLISWVAAIPLLLVLRRIPGRASRLLAGAVYGAGFYGVVNAWALPRWFGDPMPWELGVETVYPSLVVHLVYGVVIGWAARGRGRPPGPRPRSN